MARKITTVIVTYNRKKLLTECLKSIVNQTIKVDKILIINNNSTDGTEELFTENGEFYRHDIICMNMSKNLGGAGGFYEGIKEAMNTECDWVWIMDDDTIPEKDCLEKMLDANDFVMQKEEYISDKKRVAFYASCVFGEQREFMNVPNVDNSLAENGYKYYYEFLNHKIIHIADATFVSILVNREAIEKCGLPCKDYFIWGDDGEYTLRLKKYYGNAFLVGDSIAIHKRVGAKALDIKYFDEPKRVKMFHYYIRNNIINSLYYKKDRNACITIFKRILYALLSFRFVFSKCGFLKIFSVWRGTIEGFVFYNKFKRYINSQITKE